VEAHLAQAREQGEAVDYLTFVPDGEPTLDAQLSETIERLRPLGIAIAIISNASIIWRREVREALAGADWGSLKLDAVEETLWCRINRPHPSLDHRAILDGMLAFAGNFTGTLVTESMLVRGVNDSNRAVTGLVGFLGRLDPDTAYLSIPTRPPTEQGVHAPDEATLNRVYQIVSAQLPRLELLTGYEGNAFVSTGNAAADLLAITSVHPMREEAVREFLANAGAAWPLVERLIGERELMQTEYEGRKFYVRRIQQGSENE
jgi:wyosine [tRNA(Phe)-imidazoG37] synthetase (radical SAM superfamily)